MFQTLRSRLAFWHALIFAGMAVVIFVIAYQTVANQLLASLSEELHDTAVEFSDLYRTGGIRDLREEVASESLSHDGDRFFARYLDAAGNTLMVNHPRTWTHPLPLPDLQGVALQWFDIIINDGGERARMLALRSHDGGWIQVGMSLQTYDTQLRQIIRIFVWSLLVLVLVGMLVGWLQVRHVLAGVDQIRRTAMEIGEGDLDHRLVLDRHGRELVELADGFNTMLDRIQRLLGEMRDVSDHIAHDLRTPVARIRGMAESALMTRGEYAPDGEALALIIEESDRLSAMINTMLEIAQTDSGVTTLKKQTVDFSGLLQDACELFLPVAEDAGIDVTLVAGEQPLLLDGDAGRLQRLIANLLDNAIKFTPRGGRITCAAGIVDGWIELVIRDSGSGISDEALPHIFDRFYRADHSRSTPGNGLGLSYAQSIVRAHGGGIEITSVYGEGTTVVVRLPGPHLV
ncbi:HAMP domain-containing histidine kinase [Mariprofundus erugo]|uniref:sensor histidine kinase n=1 Tax=Mariprofundus erugo TaxID=2528639 RepID=UPI0010FEF1A6|nr:HAMP domain-containing sensor histidine kinase [Mariprofundus erugo]TLS78330.1 HAMP domain-containing histidine kinase [Mariprofundus erugo]